MKKIIFLAFLLINTIVFGQLQELDCPNQTEQRIVKGDSTISYACYDYDNRKNGPEIIFTFDSIKVFERKYINGLLDGLEKEYYESGNLKRIINYKNGIKNGRLATWHDINDSIVWKNGDQIEEGTFVDGYLEGYYVVKTAMSGGVIYATMMKNSREAIIGRYISWTKSQLPKFEELPQKEQKKLMK